MIILRSLRTSLVFLLVPLGLQAAPPAPAPSAPLTLDEAVQAGLRHFPTVRGSRARVEGAGAALAEARSDWFPQLELRASASRNQEPVAVYPIHGFGPGEFPPFDRTVFQGGAYLNFLVFDGGGRGARVAGARDRVQAADAALRNSESELVAQIASKFLEVLSRREALEAHDRRLAALTAERDRARQFVDAGRAARVEGLRAEAALAEAQARRVQLAGDLAGSERDLTGLTGILQDRTRAANLVPVAEADTALAPDDSLVVMAFAANPQVREADRRLAAARSMAGAAKAARLPRIELTGGYQGWSDPDGNSSDEWNAALRLTQTLFTGGEVTGRIHRTRAEAGQAEEDLRLARITTRRAVLQAADRVREADARVRSLEAAVDRYDEVARIESLSQEAGTGIQTDYLNAEADLLNARAGLSEARRAAAVARVELARLTGALTPEWLSEHLRTQP